MVDRGPHSQPPPEREPSAPPPGMDPFSRRGLGGGRSIWLPIATVVGALAALLAGYLLVTSLQEGRGGEGQDDTQGRSSETSRDTDTTESSEDQYLFRNPKALQAFERVRELEKAAELDWELLIREYEKVRRNYPGTVAAKQARERVAALKQQRSEMARQEWRQLQEESQKLREARSFLEATRQVESFMKAWGSLQEWREEGEQLLRSIQDDAERAYEVIVKEVHVLEGDGKIIEAIAKLDEVRHLGLERLLRRADEELGRLEDTLSRQRAEAEASYAPLRDEVFVRMWEEFSFDEGLEELAALEQRPELYSIREQLAVDRELLEHARDYLGAVLKGLELLAGERRELVLRSGGRFRRAELVGAKEGKLCLKMGRGEGVQELEQFAITTLLELAEPALDPEQGESHMMRGSILLLAGELEQAEAEFVEAHRRGSSVGRFLAWMEARELKQRLGKVLPLKPFLRYFSNKARTWRQVSEGRGITTSTSGFIWLHQRDYPPQGTYIFDVLAKKLGGVSGFLVGFRFAGENLLWSIGEQGEVSVVRGLTQTRSACPVEQGKQYRIRLIVTEQKAVGYFGGERRWRLEKDELAGAKRSEGIGLGSSHTEVIYMDARLTFLVEPQPEQQDEQEEE